MGMINTKPPKRLPVGLASEGWLSLDLGGCQTASFPTCTVTGCGVKLNGRIACFGDTSYVMFLYSFSFLLFIAIIAIIDINIDID
jgi:hypothetical protein